MASSDSPFPSGTNVSGTDTNQSLQQFWTRVLNDIKNLKPNDFKTQELPLARIKKIMKLDEDVKMISSEAPLLFAKACEIFIRELTLRAWIHTEDNKRRTQQRNDVAMAISKFDQFDFLIDIVPRDELKPTRKADETARAGMMPDQVQYYFQLAQQTQQALQQQQQQQSNTAAAAAAGTQQPQTQVIQIQTPNGQIIQQPIQIQTGGGDAGQQVLQIQQPAQTQQTPQVQQVQVQQPQQQTQQAQPQQQQTTTQVFQQIVTPSGEVQNVPIQLTQAQLMAIQQQMQGKQPGQQIVIQTQSQDQQEPTESQDTSLDQSQFSSTQPVFQIQPNVPQQILVQSTADGSSETVDLTDVST